MRNFIFPLVLPVIAIILHFHRSTVDQLMDVEFPVVAEEGSRLTDVVPSDERVTSLEELAEPGLITVVSIHDQHCKGCAINRENLDELLRVRPDLAVRVIEASSLGWPKTGEKYGVEIWSVPFVAIIGRDGEVLAVDSRDSDSGRELLYDWINEEIDRKNEQARNARPVGL